MVVMNDRSGPAIPGTDTPGSAHVVDRGSFTHAHCEPCGWTGPGRRSRAVARRDATDHTEGECAPDRERLSAHGRS